MFSKYPFLSRIAAFIVFPIAVASLVLVYWLSLSLPIDSGSLTVEGLQNNASIRYDKFGVPHINAEQDVDVYFALGFAHAQNRLWQMEMNRRTAAGRLSEILGITTRPSDVYMRTLGLSQNAQKMWAQLPPFEKSVLTHYVKGVNAGIAQLKNLPMEYHILEFKPEPWTEVDSLLWMQLMTVQLSSNMAAELQRSSLEQSFGLDKTNSLMPAVTVADLTQLADVSIIPPQYRTVKREIGSNSWVVSGKNSASGKPLLANDPHLTNSLPSIFYLADLNGDKLHVSGATFPGLPFVVIGKNNSIAWGVTNMMADTQDVFLEKINPNNAYQYEVDGKYRDMDVRIEKINIKKEPLQQVVKPYVFEVRRTHHGPVLSDVSVPHKYYAYSLRWTGDDEDGGTFKSFLAVNYAQNWQEFNDALASFITPIHNFMYADVEGHIGSVAPGAYPLRSSSGALPKAGWLSKNDWNGWINVNEWPRKLDPDDGIIAAANNNILAEGYPHYITADWAPNFRAARIENLLKDKLKQKKSGLTVDDFSEVQLDILDPGFNTLSPYLVKLEAKSDSQRQALGLLSNWNGKMDIDSPQPAIFAVWMAHFYRLVIEDDAKKLSHPSGGEAVLAQMVLQDNLPFIEQVILQGDKQGWCNYLSTPQVETCNEMLLTALDHAINELTKTLGTDMSAWKWGGLHIAHYPHYPFTEQKYAPSFPSNSDSSWAFLFHRSLKNRGGNNTVNVASFSLAENSRFSQFVGPSYREIIDLGAETQNQFSLSTGQSANLLSKHYDDLLEKHQKGEYIKITATDNMKSLMLIPQQAGGAR